MSPTEPPVRPASSRGADPDGAFPGAELAAAHLRVARPRDALVQALDSLDPLDPEELQVLDQTAEKLTRFYREVSRQLAVADTAKDAFGALCSVTVEVIPGAEQASITRLRNGRFETAASTGDLARRADNLQYEIGAGPCVDAAVDDRVFRSGDIGRDERWPRFGSGAAEMGIRSMLSLRLYLEDSDEIAALNIYSLSTDAFDAYDEALGAALCAHGALAITGAAARERAANLEAALGTNREIATAVGILMSAHKITQDQAFDLLRMASQLSNRKVAALSAEVVESGELRLPDQVRERLADRR